MRVSRSIRDWFIVSRVLLWGLRGDWLVDLVMRNLVQKSRLGQNGKVASKGLVRSRGRSEYWDRRADAGCGRAWLPQLAVGSQGWTLGVGPQTP
ncbi:Uncharacterised protein [Mycobacteroides abscessus subsp. abscessus]|nr:Uncharacterised protein [Mycobacteroides abscessus subsp. abscessus]